MEKQDNEYLNKRCSHNKHYANYIKVGVLLSYFIN